FAMWPSKKIFESATVIPRAMSQFYCPVCAGISVHFAVEWLSSLPWNQCPVCRGIRKQMAFCSNCGTEVAATAAFCGSCSTGMSVEETKPSQEATSSTTSVQKVSEAWKNKFALLEKAGGPKLPKVRELAFRERSKVVFNIWGFLFGPFYYLAKGMWKKAIVLFALCVTAIVVLAIILKAMGISDAITNFISPAVFAARANIDYYKKIILGENGWW
ncbi:MAG: DUF2628 domain-containing protein, partial [Gallionella sp.]|nr:DUF2628 domain-containing protein [Gallionella sp.]